MKRNKVLELINDLNLINPDLKNLVNCVSSEMVLFGNATAKVNDVSEAEIFYGYVAPTRRDLVGEELEILNGML